MLKRFTLFMLFGLLIISLVACASTAVPVPEPPSTVEEPQPESENTPKEFIYTLIINGPEEFKTDIEEAIALIKEHSYEQFVEVVTNIIIVELEEEETEFEAYSISPIKQAFMSQRLYDAINNDPKFRNETYLPSFALASFLVHEATHIRLYEERKPYKGIEGEREALAAERRLLESLGVDKETIEYFAGEHKLETRWWENAPNLGPVNID